MFTTTNYQLRWVQISFQPQLRPALLEVSGCKDYREERNLFIRIDEILSHWLDENSLQYLNQRLIEVLAQADHFHSLQLNLEEKLNFEDISTSIALASKPTSTFQSIGFCFVTSQELS